MRLFVVGAIVSAGLAIAGMAPSSPAAAANGLTITAATTYTIDPPAGVVRTQLELSFENVVAPVTEGTTIRSTFFTGVDFGIHGDATSIVAQSSGIPLAVATSPVDAEIQVLSITFPDQLDYGERLDVLVTWDLPGQPPRSAAPWRANEAFAAFVAYAYGDPGLGVVRVVAPVGVEISLPAVDAGDVAQPVVSTDGVVDVWSFEAIAEPGQFGPVVIASNDAALTETVLDVEGREVVVQAWPDDPEWTSFMGGQVTTGLTELEALIGFPVRDDRSVVIRESVEPILEGFAGWFDQNTGIIEVGEDLDPALVLHEISHAWFNSDLSGSRWINEGLAEAYANLVIAGDGGTPRQVPVPAATDPGYQPLATWEQPTTATPDADLELYGYDSSYFVMDQLIDEIGVEGMAAVLGAIEEETEAYVGDAAPETTTVLTDWRRLLDLAEGPGGSVGATELFRTYVVPPAEAGSLDQRVAARERYTALVDAGTGWAAPVSVRNAMERWDFLGADATIDAAAEVLTARDELAAAAEAADVEIPSDHEARYEAATDESDLTALAADLEELTSAVGTVEDAAATAGAPRSPEQAFGLGDRQFDTQLEAARQAIATGDADTADELAGEVTEEVEGADEAGRVAAAGLADTGRQWWWVAALAGLVAIGVVLLLRRRSGGVGPQVDAGRDPTVHGDVEAGVGGGIDLDEDALAGTRLGGVDDGLDVADRDHRE